MAKQRTPESAEREMKHPGEVLRDTFMHPFGLSARALAQAVKVSPQRISEILTGKRGISAETALHLSKLFGTPPSFWMYMQADYDLQEAQKKWSKDLDKKIKRIDVPGVSLPIAVKGAKDDTRQRVPPERVPPPVDLAGNEKTIFELLSDEQIHFDMLMEKSGLAVGEISAALTMLELSDLITRYPYEWYTRKSGR
jgi:addiction module HigA family antidote